MFNERIKRPPCLKGAGTACRDWGILRFVEAQIYPSTAVRRSPSRKAWEAFLLFLGLVYFLFLAGKDKIYDYSEDK